MIPADDPPALQHQRRLRPRARVPEGPPADWAEQLAELALADGMSAFIARRRDDAGRSLPAVRRRGARPRGPRAGRRPSALRPAASRRRQRDAVRTAAPAAHGRRGRTAGRATWSSPRPPARRSSRQLRDLVEQVAAGALDAGAARSHINAMTMRQNNWTLGTYCESYCRVVTTHHTLEDPACSRTCGGADPALGPVVDRLEEEHQVIHDVLERRRPRAGRACRRPGRRTAAARRGRPADRHAAVAPVLRGARARRAAGPARLRLGPVLWILAVARSRPVRCSGVPGEEPIAGAMRDEPGASECRAGWPAVGRRSAGQALVGVDAEVDGHREAGEGDGDAQRRRPGCAAGPPDRGVTPRRTPRP